MHPRSNNIGAYIASRLALDPTNFGAGFGNISQQNGTAFNRTAVRPLHLSGKLQIPILYTLASGHTASFMYALQDSDDDVTYADIENASGSTSLTALNSGAAQRTCAALDVDLIGARQYIRARVTPVMSHSGTDVIKIAAVWALGGGEELPPTESDA